jgi:uncharacterized membrane protein YuzA (DUF378 family)
MLTTFLKRRIPMFFIGRLLNLISAIGAINWGLVALFQFNLVEYICVATGKHVWNKYFYVAIAVAGIFTFFNVFRD